MKTIKYFAAAAIALTSFATLAAEPINSQQADSLTGVISAGTRPSLEKNWPLKQMLRAPAATAFSAGGNMLSGTAIIYNKVSVQARDFGPSLFRLKTPHLPRSLLLQKY